MDTRTAIATKPRSYRTPLGDTVTVRKVVEEDGFLWHEITLECQIELVEPGQTWPEGLR
jgi:hypothetical protein